MQLNVTSNPHAANELCGDSSAQREGSIGFKFVAVSGASNVLGVCNDLAEISCIVHRYGATTPVSTPIDRNLTN
jgi:selenocysteine lyase/cysteine desulfurase